MTDDELDAQLRGAMKVLDAEVPSGYFDTRPSEVLSHLEATSMDPTPTPTSRIEAPPVNPSREDDSGLHDIRNLAQSTKQRLSKKITVPPVSDEDLIASSSAGWKAVALPEPAKMISLPELAELPTKKQIKEAQKKAVVAPPVAVDAPAPVVAIEKPVRAAPVAQQKSKTPLYAAIGVGLAAAAGGLIYVATRGSSASEQPQVVAKNEAPPPVAAAPVPPPAPTAAPTATPIEPPPPPAQVEAPVVAPPPVETAPVATAVKKPGKKAPDVHKVEITNQTAAPATKPAAKGPEKVEKVAGKEGEPSFDDLLKEAGVKDKPKEAKPVLEKKSLSGGDFKSGMNSISGKAQACYAGTQGTAAVKLTIGPDGHVTKASVSGPFAGTPVGACVEAAVRGATFPAWDGGPASFGYSFLLSE